MKVKICYLKELNSMKIMVSRGNQSSETIVPFFEDNKDFSQILELSLNLLLSGFVSK